MRLRPARTSTHARRGARSGVPMAGRRALRAALFVFLLSGCQAVMTTSVANPTAVASPTASADARPYTGTVADWPLFFKRHMFGVTCFDTLGCSVLYDRREHGTERAAPAKASLPPERYDAVMIGTYGDLPNFPPPAEVRWTAKDGSTHEAQVDFDAIFADRLIRHHVPREDIPEDVSMGFTHIVLEVDDRTVNVYTRTLIPTREEQIPGNRYSTGRNDLIKVYSKTY